MWSISTSKRTSKATQASVDDNLSKGVYDYHNSILYNILFKGGRIISNISYGLCLFGKTQEDNVRRKNTGIKK